MTAEASTRAEQSSTSPEQPSSSTEQASPSAEQASPSTGQASNRSALVGGVRLGPAAEIPVGEGRAYAVAGEQVAVFRPRADVFRAVSAICPHAGGPLADGQIDEQVLICPLHMHVFELDTGCSKTGQADLTSYPVEVDADGFLVVQLPDPAHGQ